MKCRANPPADDLQLTALADNQIEDSQEESPNFTREDAKFNDAPAITDTEDPVVGPFDELVLTTGNETGVLYDREAVNELER